MYKMSLVHLCIKPRQTCQHLVAGNYIKALIANQNSNFEHTHVSDIEPSPSPNQLDLVEH